MPYVFFGCEQAFKATFRFLIVAIHIDQNLRRPAIVGYMYSRDANQSDAWISQFAFHQGFNLLAQGLAQSSAMIFQPALFHPSPRSKTDENIRKSTASVGSPVLLSRTLVAPELSTEVTMR